MKTVAKKPVKKAPSKAVAKVAVKVVAKKTAKPAKAVVKPVAKPALKTSVKAVKKPIVKSVAKPAPKAVVKKPVKPAAKPASKAAAKPVAKVAVKAKAVKVAKATEVPTKKLAKKADVSVAITNKAKLIKPAKPVKAEKANKPAKSKAESKLTKVESKLKQAMVIESKTAPTESKLATKIEVSETTAAPVLSKARTSRLASLTVPSMAQSIASTAAKSSYGPAVHAEAFVIPPPFAPKQNLKLANNWKNKTAEEMSDEELLAMPESEYMNIKQMTYFRLKLTQLKKGILESAGATTEHLRDESAVVPDPTDRATIEEEHALELRTRDRERKLLKKIEQSIARIDAGDYGYCDETGEAIGVGRLLARPTATLSLEAQQRRELKQKMFGD
jgi:DnaK suppressor protein